MKRAYACCLLFAVAALAAEPVAVTIDPPKPSAYQQVFVDIKGSDITAVSVLSDRDDIGCRTVKLADGGWLVITQAPASGGYSVSVAIVSKAGLYHKRHVIVDGAPKPPPFDPVKPDGKFGLIKASREAVGLVQGATRDECGALAGAFRSVVSMIGAGALTDGNAILAECGRRRAQVVDGVKWRPWANAVVSVMQAKLTTASAMRDWQDALEEIAKGLEGGGA